jgi:hypothetical protein
MSHIDAARVYPTLVTPAGFAFGIWSVIFGLQACFVIMQLLPDYRSMALLVNGIGYRYAAACVLQALWSAFTIPSERMVSSLVLSVLILAVFFTLVRSSSRYPTRTISEYVLLKAPFLLHGAWMCVVVVINVNMIVVQMSPTDSGLQIVVAALSLLVLTLSAIAASLAGDGWLAAVVCWTLGGIAWNLASPPLLLEERFGFAVLEKFVGAARAFAAVSGGIAAVLGFRGIRATRVALMMAPQHDFEPDGLVVLPMRPIIREVDQTERSGSKTRNSSGEGPFRSATPPIRSATGSHGSCVSQWFTELQPSQNSAAYREEVQEGPRCEQATWAHSLRAV